MLSLSRLISESVRTDLSCKMLRVGPGEAKIKAHASESGRYQGGLSWFPLGTCTNDWVRRSQATARIEMTVRLRYAKLFTSR